MTDKPEPVPIASLQTGDVIKMRCGMMAKIERIEKHAASYSLYLGADKPVKWRSDGRFMKNANRSLDIVEIVQSTRPA